MLADLGRIAKDESDFGSASQFFECAGNVLLGLISRGKHENWPGLDARHLQNLREMAEECREAPLALGALGAIPPRAAGEAIRLLKTRARLMASGRRWPEFVEAVVALHEVEPKVVEDLYAQARGLGLCLKCIDEASPELPLKDQQYLRESCIERCLADLNQAAKHGFNEVSLLENDDALAAIRQHPAYSELIARLNGNPPPRAAR